ncbi:hypothetical protein CLOLEP_01057 [[Clostridium] leptum DSM 753]|uniref:Uncharacterized protein n=2 Tax=[Clostridium] leptum TaxID=1535 RepID=A7VR73_9FIRM|nr:hypothetical protein CLOLEP_01057 [[Clostridium] leptum DSM 753]CDC05471.1 uncharacterized protein BN578_00956 [[Clostridium] leptum CAG:27]
MERRKLPYVHLRRTGRSFPFQRKSLAERRDRPMLDNKKRKRKRITDQNSGIAAFGILNKTSA